MTDSREVKNAVLMSSFGEVYRQAKGVLSHLNEACRREWYAGMPKMIGKGLNLADW
jgi:hypothetical protein